MAAPEGVNREAMQDTAAQGGLAMGRASVVRQRESRHEEAVGHGQAALYLLIANARETGATQAPRPSSAGLCRRVYSPGASGASSNNVARGWCPQSWRGKPISDACGEIRYSAPIQAPTALASRNTAKMARSAHVATACALTARSVVASADSSRPADTACAAGTRRRTRRSPAARSGCGCRRSSPRHACKLSGRIRGS